MDKITELESRIAYFENMVEELSSQIYNQSIKIEKQERKITALTTKYNALHEALGEDYENRKPPHY